MIMKCEEVKIFLPEYIDGRLDEAATEAIRSHLGSCARCNELFNELHSFLSFTDQFPEEVPPFGMKTEFMELIDNEMPQRAKRIFMMPGWLKVAAIVIAILATYSTGYYLGSEKGRGQNQQLEVALNQTKQQVLLTGLLDLTGPQKIGEVYKISQSGQSGDRMVDALVYAMNSEKNINVRLAAINALSGMINKNHRVKNELIHSLSLQDNSLLQISLIQVLTESGVKEARDEIESLVQRGTTDERVKTYAKDMIKIII